MNKYLAAEIKTTLDRRHSVNGLLIIIKTGPRQEKKHIFL